VGTWNVNGRLASESLAPWLSYDAADADIYVIGCGPALSHPHKEHTHTQRKSVCVCV
jgi:hypothetical protein